MTYHADQELFKNTLKNNYISIYIGITRYYPFITIHSKNGLPASNLLGIVQGTTLILLVSILFFVQKQEIVPKTSSSGVPNTDLQIFN